MTDRVDQLLADWRRERPELQVEPLAVVGRILMLGRRLEARANAALKDIGLQYTDLDVLATLRRSGKPYRLTPTELRDCVLITSGAMTACLDRLEQNGFIVRRDNPRDRRSKSAELTTAGRRLIDKAMVMRVAEAADAVKGLSANEQAALAKLLRKLGEGME